MNKFHLWEGMRRPSFIWIFFFIATMLLVCIPCAALDNSETCTQKLIDLESYHWGNIGGPGISGSTVVFSADGNITLFDLGTNQIKILTQDGNNQLSATGGNSVVWVHKNPSGTANMYLYDIVTGQQRKIPDATGPRTFRGLATDGRSIVWADSRNGNFDVFMYNIVDGTETQLSRNLSDQNNPAIDGTKVVWTDHRRYQNSDIYLYDLTNQSYTRITTDAAQYPDKPKISGGRIVWEDLRNDNAVNWEEPRYLDRNYDIYLYDLNTGKETLITTHKSAQHEPAIFGDTIIWNDERDSPLLYPHPACPAGSFCPVETAPPTIHDIYLYNITTGTEEKLYIRDRIYHDSYGSYTGYPAINGNKIVWKEGRAIAICDRGFGQVNPEGQVVTGKASRTPIVIIPRPTPLSPVVCITGIIVGLVVFGLNLKKKDL